MSLVPGQSSWEALLAGLSHLVLVLVLSACADSAREQGEHPVTVGPDLQAKEPTINN